MPKVNEDIYIRSYEQQEGRDKFVGRASYLSGLPLLLAQFSASPPINSKV